MLHGEGMGFGDEEPRARFERLMRLVDQALDNPESQREALLERECSDEALREQARRLLAADSSDDALLSSPAGDRLPDALLALTHPKEDMKWPPAYAARRIAWHVLDHAWEIQDRSKT